MYDSEILNEIDDEFYSDAQIDRCGICGSSQGEIKDTGFHCTDCGNVTYPEC